MHKDTELCKVLPWSGGEKFHMTHGGALDSYHLGEQRRYLGFAHCSNFTTQR